MRKLFLAITLILAITTLIGGEYAFTAETVLHKYDYYYGDDTENPADHLSVHVQKHATISSSPIPFTHGRTQYFLYAFGYAAADAEPIVDDVNDTFYTATAWCETTGDKDTKDVPSRNTIDTTKKQTSDGKEYFGDEYRWYSMDNTTEAGVTYKKHPVASIHDNPFKRGDQSAERYFNLSQTSYKIDFSDDTPTGLDANPYAKAEIDSTAISYLSIPMGSKSASTPVCTGSSKHTPGPCPDN